MTTEKGQLHTMNDELLESLLHEDEGASLDFKREQYAFEGATEEEKSELLKDLLAMANAWRTGPAHILVGVEEVRGGRSRVVGEDDHPGEHTLQQFVNAKTNRPIEFSYRVYEYEGERVGIFRIPRQRRPFYLEEEFGRLEAGVAYVRRGSATVTADLDEVAEMRAEFERGSARPPTLELEWADLSARERLGTHPSIAQLRLHPRPDPGILKPRRRSRGPFDFSHDVLRSVNENPNYYEELVEYVYRHTWLTPLGFTLEHAGGPAAKAVELVAEIERREGVSILDPADAPSKPNRSTLVDMVGVGAIRRRGEPDVVVAEHPGHWTVTVPFGDVVPRRRVWSTNSLYVGATESTSIEFTARLYAENLSEPTKVEMGLSLDVESRKMEPSDVRPYKEE